MKNCIKVPKALAGCTINKALMNPVKDPRSELFKILIPATTNTIEIARPPIISSVGLFFLTLIILHSLHKYFQIF